MTDTTTPSTVVTLGTEPVNPFLKALQDAGAAIKAEADSKAFRDMVIQGIFSFLEMEFAPADPLLEAVEPFVQKEAETGAK